MGKVYVGQTSVKIEATVGEDLTSATVKRIYYSKPSGSTGFFTATVTA